MIIIKILSFHEMYKGADKSSARPGRKQATATEDFDFIYPIYNHNCRNISIIYIYNKTNIKRNSLTIQKIHREVGRAKDLSAPLTFLFFKDSDMFYLIVSALHKLLSATEMSWMEDILFTYDTVKL
jgi:hypothetical protein